MEFYDDGHRALEIARELATAQRSRYIRPVHILLGTLRALAGILQDVARARGLDDRRLGEFMPAEGDAPENKDPVLSEASRRVIEAAHQCSMGLGFSRISAAHLMLGLLRAPDREIAPIFERFGVDRAGLEREFRERMPANTDGTIGGRRKGYSVDGIRTGAAAS